MQITICIHLVHSLYSTRITKEVYLQTDVSDFTTLLGSIEYNGILRLARCTGSATVLLVVWK